MKKTSQVLSLPFIKKEAVRDRIKSISTNETESLDVLCHASLRMKEREITLRQVINVLKNGEQQGDITWCTETERGWKCKLSRVTAGSKITVVAKLVERNKVSCLVVTTWES